MTSAQKIVRADELDHALDEVAMAAVEGVNVTHMVGTARIMDMQDEPQRAAFNAYRVAFRRNEAEPKLRNAAALVHAYNAFADLMGIDRV